MLLKTISILLLFLFLSTTNGSKNIEFHRGMYYSRSDTDTVTPFPYSAWIMTWHKPPDAHYYQAETELFCSGALVSEKYVITGGKCAHQAVRFRIKLGPTYISECNTIAYNYDEIMETKPIFSERSFVALIPLNPKCTINKHIKPATLPTLPWNARRSNNKAVAVGFDEIDKDKFVLKWLRMETLSTDDCWLTYPTIFINAVVCAKEDGMEREISEESRILGEMGLCNTIGTALVAEDKTLIGISLSTCDQSLPGPQIYGHISWFKDWISEQIRK